MTQTTEPAARSAMLGKRIGVLLGGLSAEREVSLKSGKAMAGALERKGYTVIPIDVGRDLPRRLLEEKIEVALLALHGPFGEDGTVQGLLELMGIPYTGSGVATSALCMDKGMTKKIFRSAGVPTPEWRQLALRDGESPAQAAERLKGELFYPLFLKPVSSGSSVGVASVEGPEGLADGLEVAFAASPQVLAERLIRGSELTMSVLDGEAFPFIQIKPLAGFYDFTNKYTAGRTQYLIPPPDVGEADLERARQAGLAAYAAAGCRGLARVDFMVEADGTPWVLEINTIPGMTELSLAPKAAGARGIGFDDLVERILLGAGLELCA